jgi:hypothetical protein
MNVYIVTKSWDYEATYIEKVFADPVSALAYCKEQIDESEGELVELPTGYKKRDLSWIYEEFPIS